ncbi:uncharacterized protein LOC134283743 [Saccostrea cucullata]|uniref:uncharacterized protein LOC134283743 n=1 Tax=Saccostrea cuccullata TaxID=36930 RepID=UPI002ED5F30B
MQIILIYNSAGCWPGYFGFRCDFNCRYPNFGKYCQERCDCLKNECDNVLGCRENMKEKSFHLIKKARSKQAPSVSIASVSSVLSLILVMRAVFWFYKFRIRTWFNKRREDGLVHRNKAPPQSKPINCIETENQDRASFCYFSNIHVKRQNQNSDINIRNAVCQLDVSNLYEAVEYPTSGADDSFSAPYPKPSFIFVYSKDDNELLIPIDQ